MTLTEPNTTTPAAPPAVRRQRSTPGSLAVRYFAVLAFVALCIYFSFASPVFATGCNVTSVLSASALLAVV